MEATTKKEILCNKTIRSGKSGFSLIEVIIVLVIVSVLTAISVPYIINYKKLYKPEDQALKVMDLMREAGQMALTRRRTIRLEVDLTDNKVLLIDEDTRVVPAVHREIKAIPLESVADVRMDRKPTGISKPNPPNYNDVVASSYITDTTGHVSGGTTVTGHKVWALRFRSDGSVVNKTNSPISATLYFWTPLTPGSPDPKKKEEVRAVTIFGGSGAIRYWKHNGTKFLPY